MSPQEEYKVHLDVFEGPLDLLLYLIKKDELDIYDIPIERITRQYLQYMDLMRMLDLNIAGDFIVMAATLMMIKSRMLLPPEERAAIEEEEEDDPRWDLVRQLVEYKKFKDAALHLESLEEQRLDVFAREGEHVQLGPAPEIALHDVSLFDLISAFGEVLKRVKTEELKEIFSERFTVAEKMEHIVRRLQAEARIEFGSLFEHLASRHEIVCIFLALLELIRLRQLVARQESSFGPIMLMQMEGL
ncbi:MAG: segregation/condensation protein A [Verrucomicrobia bacterium]|nr:segregation/condensation protein A [Verrucomicrobiota bacterium]